jgi:hypothetical protein
MHPYSSITIFGTQTPPAEAAEATPGIPAFKTFDQETLPTTTQLANGESGIWRRPSDKKMFLCHNYFSYVAYVEMAGSVPLS